jgi:hypothetical protein
MKNHFMFYPKSKHYYINFNLLHDFILFNDYITYSYVLKQINSFKFNEKLKGDYKQSSKRFVKGCFDLTGKKCYEKHVHIITNEERGYNKMKSRYRKLIYLFLIMILNEKKRVFLFYYIYTSIYLNLLVIKLIIVTIIFT